MDTTNLILAAILPLMSDFAARLQLPVALPITAAELRKDPRAFAWRVDYWFNRDASLEPELVVGILMTNGYGIGYQHGFVSGFSGPLVWSDEQEIEAVPRYYGRLRMTRDEAVAMARQALRNFGYSLEDLYADLDPVVDMPPKIRGGHIVPRYVIHWKSPFLYVQENPPDTIDSVEIEVDAMNKRIVALRINNERPWRPEAISVQPPPPGRFPPYPRAPMGEAGKRLALDAILPQAREAIQRVNWPIAGLSERGVARVGGTYHNRNASGVIIFTNGLRLHFNGPTNALMLDNCALPDTFFSPWGEIKVRDFEGTIKISERRGVRIAREFLMRFAPTINLQSSPRIYRPMLPKTVVVPRRLFKWEGGLAEVDLQTGAVKVLQISGNTEETEHQRLQHEAAAPPSAPSRTSGTERKDE